MPKPGYSVSLRSTQAWKEPSEFCTICSPCIVRLIKPTERAQYQMRCDGVGTTRKHALNLVRKLTRVTLVLVQLAKHKAETGEGGGVPHLRKHGLACARRAIQQHSLSLPQKVAVEQAWHLQWHDNLHILQQAMSCLSVRVQPNEAKGLHTNPWQYTPLHITQAYISITEPHTTRI